MTTEQWSRISKSYRNLTTLKIVDRYPKNGFVPAS